MSLRSLLVVTTALAAALRRPPHKSLPEDARGGWRHACAREASRMDVTPELRLAALLLLLLLIIIIIVIVVVVVVVTILLSVQALLQARNSEDLSR